MVVDVRKGIATWSHDVAMGWHAVRWAHADPPLACAHGLVPSIGGACMDDSVAAVIRSVCVSSQPISSP